MDQASLDYIFERVHTAWNIDIFLMDSKGKILLWKRHNPDARISQMQGKIPSDNFQKVYDQVTKGRVPYFYVEKDVFYTVLIPSGDGNLIVLGPAVFEQPSFRQTMEYRREHQVSERDVEFTRIPLMHAMSLACAICFAVTGARYTEDDLLQANRQIRNVPDRDRAIYDARRQNESDTRNSYSQEREYLHRIETGTLEPDMYEMTSENMTKMQKIGTLSDNDSYKQVEYMLVTSNALACRAAMKGGVPTYEAYVTSDLYDQRISKCNNIVQLISLQMEMSQAYSDMVKKYQEERKDNDIASAKDFVVRNLNRKISLTRIAEEVGRNPSYLSRKFAEQEGVTLRQYILRERLRAAANMLRYSDEGISTIAGYLQFSSQSYFGVCFKEQYGMTPNSYRRKYKVIDFSEASLDEE